MSRRADLDRRRRFFARAPGAARLGGLALGEAAGRPHALTELRRRWRKALEPLDGRRVLELGCAAGGELAYLTGRGARSVGLELTAARLESTSAVAPAAVLVVGDAERLPFAAATFDRVVGNSVLLHLDRRRAFAELERVLAPGGRAVFLEPLDAHPLLRLYRSLLARRRGLVDYPSPAELARPYRLELVELSCWYLTAALPVLAARPPGRLPRPGLTKLLGRLDERLFRRAGWRRRAWLALAVYRKPGDL
ncbi:MAG: methyltransferase domain-containing protein [Candidatus Coatesbacteria bacterium]|nr:methyltransferase domain-containing protein [Candidatus Coatesbacteria bacterium]